VPPGLINVVAIAAGGSHNLALKVDGTVVAWGSNTSGQTNVPAGLTDIVAVAAGSSHSLALKREGTVVAWGSNTSGQTNVPPGLTNVAAITAGASHSLALISDGTVVAWGSNSYGQTNTPSGLTGVTAISGGQGDSLALIGNGAPWFGPVVPARQALAGSAVSLSVPVTGELPLALRWQFNGTNLSDGTNPVLALTNLQMAQAGSYRLAATNAWGGAVSAEMVLTVLPFRILTNPQPRTALLRGDTTFSAQLEGQGPFTNQWLFNGNPLPLGTNAALTLTNIQWSDVGRYSVRVSNRHGTITSAEASLAVTPVAAWGWNGQGQTNVPAGLTNVVAVASGASHTLALKRDGTLGAWGMYEYGQNPVTPPAGLSNIVGVAAGNSFSAVLKADGTVGAWSDYSTPATNLPAGLSNVVSVAAGYDKAMALQADGTVVTWGTSWAVPEGIGPIVQIASGGSHFLALRAEGTVVAWGDSSYGQTNVPPWLSNVVAVAGGLYNSIAARADGTVVAWGSNSSGQTNVPPGTTNIVGVAAGGTHSAALNARGSVVAWGTSGSGITNVPPDLRGVVRLVGGSYFSTAMVGDGSPWFAPAVVRYTALAGLDANLMVPVSGGLPLGYQWQWYGTNLPGATNAFLTLPNLGMNRGGPYRLVASNSFGVVTSPDLVMTTVPMRIHFQPRDTTVVSGQPASLSVSLDGQGPFAYKWLHDGQPVTSGTNSFLSIAATSWTDAGRYLVIVSNVFGSVTSAGAELRVIPVVAWGSGDYVTTAPKDLTNAIALAAGGGQILAVRRNGSLAAWDASGSGSWLTDIPSAASNTVAVATGSSHCLALQSNGTVLGWGHPWYSGSEKNPPADLSNAVAISAGGGHSMALKADGHVVAWGNAIQNTVPPGLDNVVAIADGGFHSLALLGDGRVVAWGLNDSGQSSLPADLTDVIAIGAGDNQSLAVRADGRLVMWGFTAQGQMNVPPSLSNVVAIASGYVHNLALRSDGSTVTWGGGASGQTNVPPWLGSNFVSVACGSYLGAVLEENGPPFVPPVVRSRVGLQGLTTRFYVPATGGRPLAYQWQFKGTNLPGATSALLSLTNLAPSQTGNYRLIVSNAWGSAASSDISLGVEPLRVTWPPQNTNSHLSGVITLTATVEGKEAFAYQWLFNGQSLIGQTNATLNLTGLEWSNQGSYSLRISNAYGTVTSAAAAVQLSPLVAPFNDAYLQANLPSGLRDIVAVAGGGDNLMALRSNRTVVAWGDNTYGQTNVPTGLNNVVAIAASWAHRLALKADGTVVAWGLNTSGQTNVPTGLNNVVAIAAGVSHSLALKADGTVVAWGEGSVGGQSDVPPGLSNVVAIAAGSYSLALKADGMLAAWGTYWSGYGNPVMTVPPDLTDVVGIGAGSGHAVAVRSDGRVFDWGASYHNQTLVPADLTNAVAVAGNYLGGLALRSDSTVIGWGYDRYDAMLAPEVTNVVAIAEDADVGLIGDGPPYLPPRFADRSGPAGSTIHLNLRATGKRPMAYQWFLNGTPVSGATNSLLSLRGLSPHQAGKYSLQASNALGTATVSNLNVRLDGFWLGAEPSQDPTQYKLGVFGPSNSRCAVLVSSNLATWAELRRLTNSGQIQIIPDSKVGRSRRFYRLMSY
jgi:alpha-tubulin suppressor-like RCC1 family protein